MATIMELAREIVIDTYSACPHIADIRQFCDRWSHRYVNNNTISCGMFRQTIIPADHMFVIKTGLVQGGNKQCRRELDFYRRAVEQGLEQYFAQCYGSFRCGSCTFYVYEYVAGIGNGDGDAEWYIKDDRLADFIDDNEINDLHDENYALDDDDNIVLTDYSGYWYEDRKGMKTVYPY